MNRSAIEIIQLIDKKPNKTLRIYTFIQTRNETYNSYIVLIRNKCSSTKYKLAERHTSLLVREKAEADKSWQSVTTMNGDDF